MITTISGSTVFSGKFSLSIYNINFNSTMKTSMTLFGCGPKLALLCLPD